MTTVSEATYSTRKWIGVVFIFMELFTSSATIYGFSALYNVLANNNIYQSECISKTEENSNKTVQTICRDQSRQYEVNTKNSSNLFLHQEGFCLHFLERSNFRNCNIRSKRCFCWYCC